MVHGEAWTVKELFVYPNEYIYWTIQIVMYPFLTGLVAGAFVLSSLYHVFGVKPLKDIARFSLVFSFALLPCAPLPLLLHLQQPLRNHHVLMTPHFTSAIAAFGIVFLTYGMIVASELWFVYRGYFAVTARQLKGQRERTRAETIRMHLFSVLVLGAWDVSHRALEQDEKAVKILAAVGIPVACFLHGYAGFIFGSVKANALWMTPLMPVIFICSAVVSGIALCILTYIVTMELRKFVAAWRRRDNPGLPAPAEHGEGEANVVRMTSRYLIMFLILAITLELLDLIFRGYTAVKSWDILRSVIYGKDFVAIFVLQYGLGNLVPFILFLLPGLTVRRAVAGTLLVLFGVFMMRWNVVIGGQAFSASFAGFMHYHLPIIPHDLETFKEGLFGALAVGSVPFVLFWLLSRIFPVFGSGESD
ncbi:NrfD/PsrC family molybdoenzyme membrane anchor subunit [Geobacter sulfurreducens]|uniref:NrfD/PsrC family molybdoenzyme membrane anchor subunit n=1 Tax=Geobacter sulfurreducens TaxID=35554 RepID=UPI002B62E5D2|nr:NrfD/PsrC family molybdoenzyme membrane anchor subunit [Geobacter sulfurreducens]HML77320.1 polysulfide reductase NrfD [Geobacter sulfurreducens]